MQLRVMVNGWFSNVHIAVELYLMKGPNDDLLMWPLIGKLELKLLNQISDSEHHLVIVDFHGVNSRMMICRVPVHSTDERSASAIWWNNEFISHEDFYRVTATHQFLRDDCIFFQVCKFNYC